MSDPLHEQVSKDFDDYLLNIYEKLYINIFIYVFHNLAQNDKTCYKISTKFL